MSIFALRKTGHFLAAIIYTTTLSQSVGQQVEKVSDVWTDPDTHLSWTTKDNGEDISWKAANNYCKRLKLSGLSDWRMPTMSETKSLFDKHAESSGTMGNKRYHNVDTATWHVKGRIFLTGNIWTALQDPKERCFWTCYAPYFDFNEGRADMDPAGWPYPYLGMRVLCVRGLQPRTQSSSDGARV